MESTLLLLLALPQNLVQVTTHPWISVFASILIFWGFPCFKCEQFRAGPLQNRTSNLRWAPLLFAAYMITHSSNNGPAPVTCNICSSFAGCSGTDVSLCLAEEGLYICGHAAPVRQLLTRLQVLDLLLESSQINTDSSQFLCHSSFMSVPFSCHFLCWINQNSPSTTIRHTVH